MRTILQLTSVIFFFGIWYMFNVSTYQTSPLWLSLLLGYIAFMRYEQKIQGWLIQQIKKRFTEEERPFIAASHQAFSLIKNMGMMLLLLFSTYLAYIHFGEKTILVEGKAQEYNIKNSKLETATIEIEFVGEYRHIVNVYDGKYAQTFQVKRFVKSAIMKCSAPGFQSKITEEQLVLKNKNMSWFGNLLKTDTFHVYHTFPLKKDKIL